MKYGFIGCGAMGSAIVSGLVGGNKTVSNILVYDKNSNAQSALVNKYNVTSCETIDALIKKCDRVILAVKPDILPTLLKEIGNFLIEREAVIISIAAGISLSQLEEMLPIPFPIIRVMPNINVSINAGVLGYCCNNYVTEQHKIEIVETFSLIGQVLEIQEKLFDIFTVLASSAPAFVYSFIEILALTGVKYGLKKEDAKQLAANMILGSAKMASETPEHPLALADKVCSPGGVTICGMMALKEKGFEAAVSHAVDKSMEAALTVNRG